jgi:hypothetical protein
VSVQRLIADSGRAFRSYDFGQVSVELGIKQMVKGNR